MPALHRLLAERHSPMRFRVDRDVTEHELQVLLEAARRAPSAGNSQPWAFLVARRGDRTHRRLAPHLARSSSAWAPEAGLLVVNLAQRFVAGTDFEYSEFAHYDLGQAVAHMTVQAVALGLQAHQFRAFDRAAVEAEFAVPPHWEATSMTAIGHADDGAPAHGTVTARRERKPLSELCWPTATPGTGAAEDAELAGTA
ncbi:nitroreductase family protein [Actinocatenispora thailandica]|nr:nitroreductase family protein [Actinocatenispora thailandica]